MKQTENGGRPSKRYPFRFSVPMYLLFGAGLLLAAVGFGVTLWRFIHFLRENPSSIYGWIQYIILFFSGTFLTVIIVAMLIRSQYVITDAALIQQFGIIRSKYPLKSIRSVHLFKGLNKLVVYFDDYGNKYVVIVIQDSRYDEFVKELTERRPEIGFSFSTPEEEEEFKKK